MIVFHLIHAYNLALKYTFTKDIEQLVKLIRNNLENFSGGMFCIF